MVTVNLYTTSMKTLMQPVLAQATHVELHPVNNNDDGDWQICSHEEADNYALYFRLHDGTARWFADLPLDFDFGSRLCNAIAREFELIEFLHPSPESMP